MPIEIREHTPGEDVADFLRVAKVVYGGDSNYVPPLDFDLRDRMNPAKNPMFEHLDATLFTAWREGELVGRCSAQIDRLHVERWQEKTGFFGFFDTVDDAEVARALLSRAGGWLAARGMTAIRGPLSFNMNDEVGLLVEGFEMPAVFGMNYAKPYQGALAEAAGLTKVKDLYAWKYVVPDIPPRAERAWKRITGMDNVTIRSIDPKKLNEEIALLTEIFNETWEDNWGFVPATEAEGRKLAEDVKMILDPNMVFFAEIDGEPAAMCVTVPNLNEVTRDFGGKLFPFNVLKLLWRTKVRTPESARLIMLGVRPSVQRKKQFVGLATAMFVELAKRGYQRGYQWGELSYTLEDNHLINQGIKSMGSTLYKRYRLYEKPLEGAEAPRVDPTSDTELPPAPDEAARDPRG